MANTIIFLGAGASKADGAPLQAELFKSYVHSLIGQTNLDPQNRCQKNKQNILTYFKNFFGIDLETAMNNNQIEDLSFPTFEEALGILDLAISKNEQYRSYTSNLQSIRTSLIFSMAAAIQHQLDFTNQNKHEYHRKLIRQLEKPLLNKNIVLVSTNYDLLADNAILHIGANCDYGFEYSNFDSQNSIRLLKIHGSLNWLFCPVCKHIQVNNAQKAMIDATLRPNDSRCRFCQSIQSSIIIPPTYYKDMSNPYLQKVYELTEQELLSAKEIIFCGYSFPDADMHIKYLLKRAEQNSNRSTPLEIKIINHGFNPDEENRYLRFFKDKSNVHYIKDSSFEDFSNDPRRFLSSI